MSRAAEAMMRAHGADGTLTSVGAFRTVRSVHNGAVAQLPDEANPHSTVARYVDAMAPGSFLVLSHGVHTGQQRYQALRRMYDQSSTPAAVRTREQIQAFMAGTEIIEPGVVGTPRWRPETSTADHPEPAVIYAAVGRKP